MYDYGLRQSQAVTEAAQELTRAKEWFGVVFSIPERWSEKQKQDAKDGLIAAQAAYDAAFKLYTNPFNVTKTFS